MNSRLICFSPLVRSLSAHSSSRIVTIATPISTANLLPLSKRVDAIRRARRWSMNRLYSQWWVWQMGLVGWWRTSWQRKGESGLAWEMLKCRRVVSKGPWQLSSWKGQKARGSRMLIGLRRWGQRASMTVKMISELTAFRLRKAAKRTVLQSECTYLMAYFCPPNHQEEAWQTMLLLWWSTPYLGLLARREWISLLWQVRRLKGCWKSLAILWQRLCLRVNWSSFHSLLYIGQVIRQASTQYRYSLSNMSQERASCSSYIRAKSTADSCREGGLEKVRVLPMNLPTVTRSGGWWTSRECPHHSSSSHSELLTATLVLLLLRWRQIHSADCWSQKTIMFQSVLRKWLKACWCVQGCWVMARTPVTQAKEGWRKEETSTASSRAHSNLRRLPMRYANYNRGQNCTQSANLLRMTSTSLRFRLRFSVSPTTCFSTMRSTQASPNTSRCSCCRQLSSLKFLLIWWLGPRSSPSLRFLAITSSSLAYSIFLRLSALGLATSSCSSSSTNFPMGHSVCSRKMPFSRSRLRLRLPLMILKSPSSSVTTLFMRWISSSSPAFSSSFSSVSRIAFLRAFLCGLILVKWMLILYGSNPSVYFFSSSNSSPWSLSTLKSFLLNICTCFTSQGDSSSLSSMAGSSSSISSKLRWLKFSLTRSSSSSTTRQVFLAYSASFYSSFISSSASSAAAAADILAWGLFTNRFEVSSTSLRSTGLSSRS